MLIHASKAACKTLISHKKGNFILFKLKIGGISVPIH